MYTCVEPLGQLLHTHPEKGAESAFLKFNFTDEGNSGGKNLLLRSGLELGSDALQTTAFVRH